MSLLAKFDALSVSSASLAEQGVDPTNVVLEKMLSPTRAVVQGKEVLLAGTNNYLGLTFDSDAIAAGKAALDAEGTGTTGSRMANGNYASHAALEAEIAAFYGVPYAMLFATGYAANLGVLNALLDADSAALLDADAHASLYDGCKLAGTKVYRFKHNDPTSLDKRLTRLGSQASKALVIVEGLYSILGDVAPLPELVEVTHRHGALLFVDEAHSLGIYGATGRGLCQDQGVEDQVDFVVGTFSKSLGATGGYAVSRHSQLALFRYASRPYIFTASPCPSVVATTRATLKVVAERPQLQRQIWQNADRLYSQLAARGFSLGPNLSPVVAVRGANANQVVACWQQLLHAGLYVNLIVPPASPDGSSLLRLSVSAAHTKAEIDQIIELVATHCAPLSRSNG